MNLIITDADHSKSVEQHNAAVIIICVAFCYSNMHFSNAADNPAEMHQGNCIVLYYSEV